MKDVFLDSDTDMMVLSFVPSRREASPLEIESADDVRRIVDRMEGNHRLLIHGRVNPNQPGDIEDMPRLQQQFGVCAWKSVHAVGPGWQRLLTSTDDVGIRFVEEARRLGVKIICVHKGLPFGPESYEHSQCRTSGSFAIGPMSRHWLCSYDCGPNGRPLCTQMTLTPSRRASSTKRMPTSSSR